MKPGPPPKARGWRCLAMLLSLASLLAACVEPDGPAGPTVPEASTGPQPSVSRETPGGTLRVGLGVEPWSLDPAHVLDREGELIVGSLFEPLVRLDESLQVIAGAAKDWSISDDGRSYLFTLREAAFHDGRPVTAHDVKRGFDRIAGHPAREASPLAFLLDGIVGAERPTATGGVEGVQVIDDQTLRIMLQRPDAAFLVRLSHPALVPVPPEAEVDPAAFAQQPVGNGPFQMSEPRAPGAFIRMSAVADHHRQARVDEVLFTMYLDDASGRRQWQDLNDGTLHVTRMPPDLLDEAGEQFGRSPDGYRGPGVINGLTTTVYSYAFTVDRPPFNDADARRALSLAIDREALAREVMRDSRQPADSLVPPPVPGHQPGACQWCRFDPEEARRLWNLAEQRRVGEPVDDAPSDEANDNGRDEGTATEPDGPSGSDEAVSSDETRAGTDDDQETEGDGTGEDDANPDRDDPEPVPLGPITLVYPRGAVHAAIASRIAANVDDVLGISVILQAYDLPQFWRAVQEGNASIFRVGWEPTEPHPAAYLDPLFHTRSLGVDNFTRWSDGTLDAQLDLARESTPAGTVFAEYRHAERRALDAAAVIPLLYYRHDLVVAPVVQRLRISATGSIDFAVVSLDGS